MTDTIEQKALALVREVDNERGDATVGVFYRGSSCAEALCRAIEQHEAFRQDVSDAVVKHIRMTDEDCSAIWCNLTRENLERFIIAKLDPLVEAVIDCGLDPSEGWPDEIRAAIEKRGGKIVWGEG